MIDRSMARRLAAIAADRLGDDVAPYVDCGVGRDDFGWMIECFGVISAAELAVGAAARWWLWGGRGLYDPCPLAAFSSAPVGPARDGWEATIRDALISLKNQDIESARKANFSWDFDFARPYYQWQEYIQRSLIRPAKKHPELKFDPDDVPTWIVDLAHFCAEFRSDSGDEYQKKHTLKNRILGVRSDWDIEGMRLARWAKGGA